MMAMVLGIYLLSTTPQVICGLMLSEIAAQGTSFMYNIDRLTSLAWWFQSFLNPVIYAWQSKEFKTAFRKLLKIKRNEIEPYAS